jgi:hypothetical protein
VCTVSGTTVTIVGVGTCTITASQAGDANYNAATPVSQTVTITQATQTITFGAATPASRGFSTTPFTISPLATTTSGLPITYAGSGACTVSGTSVTTTALGTCTITASQAGNANFSAATSQTQTVMIVQGAQTITFGGPTQVQLTTTVGLSVSATSGLAVTVVSSTPSICTVSGATVTGVSLGTCSLTLSQAGNANFSAAPNVSASIQVIPLGGIVVTASSNPSNYRQTVTLNIRVLGTNPTGTISVTKGSATEVPVPVCTNVPMVNAEAACVVSGTFLTTSPSFFSVNYGGDASNPPSSILHQQLVNTDAVTLSAIATPQQVLAGQNLTLRAMVTGRNLTGRISFFENGATLSGCADRPISLLPGATEIGVATCTVSSASAGSHSYAILYSPSSILNQVVVNATVAASGPQDYTDLWWGGQAENGWGISINQHGDRKFPVLYIYDDAGRPTFYTIANGVWETNQRWTGSIFLSSSSPYFAYNASSYRFNAVGTATITYSSSSTATLTYNIGGRTGTKQIERLSFEKEASVPRLQVGDMWWVGTAENGWGMSISQQGRQLFPVWFTYNNQGNPTYFTVPGGTWIGNEFTGDIYSSNSSPWIGVNYVAANFMFAKVGTMKLVFSDQSNATMTYTIFGATPSQDLVQTKTITRTPF